MNKRRLGVGIGILAATCILRHGPGLGQTPGRASSHEVLLVPRGAGSCSATACHGDTTARPGKILGNEHTLWITRDRHSEAYRTLFDERSRRIAARLPGPSRPAHKDERCLACHATPVASPSSAPASVLMSDGVGCESCHGASERWIGEHFRGGWPGQTPQTEARFGLVPTVDLVRRAQICAGCHVGGPAHDGLPARDVNHDLIAAGHPRLNFELTAYLANMPHHWRDDVGRDADRDFPARGWAIGQVVSARAALELLRDRARRAEAGGNRGMAAPWPEFAEYGCFSCHHDLRDDPWRRQAPIVSSPPGRNRWGSWHFPWLETLAASDPEANDLGSSLQTLRRLMDAPSAEPADVAAQAAVVSAALGRWLDRLSGQDFDARRVNDLIARLSSVEARSTVKSWDEATQRYLALVPLSQALKMLAPGQVRPDQRAELTRLLGTLKPRYPGQYDSPKSYNPTAARVP